MRPLLNIQTPQTEAATVNSIDAEELTFGSREPSFVSPNKKDAWKSFKTVSTPLPSKVFSDRTNTLNAKREFTPLLQSAVKNGISSHFQSQKRSDFKENFPKDEEDKCLSDNCSQEVSSSSVASVKSIINLSDRNIHEKEGNTATLTLREQEKIIDTMRKENWGLKLKIHFLNDRLDKLAPDQIEVALKENIENKIQQAKLIQEIKKYKKSLLESEKKIKVMSIDKEKELESNEIISEQKKILDKIALENNQYANKLFEAQEKIETMSKEIEGLKNLKTDIDVSEKLSYLEEQLQQALEKNEEMEIELKEKQNKIDEQNDEIELQEEEHDKLKQIIEELEQKCFSKEHEKIDEYNNQVDSLKNDLDIIKKRLDEKEKIIQKFMLEKDNSDELYSELEKTRSDLNKISIEYYEFKNTQKEKVYNLEKSYKDISDELQIKEKEIAFLHTQLETKDFSISDKDGNIQKVQDILNEKYKLEEDLKNAQDNIKELHINLEEYDDRQEELENDLKQKEEELIEVKFNLKSLQKEFDTSKLEYEKEKKDIYNQIVKSEQDWDEERIKLISETETIQASLKQYQDRSERMLLTLQEEKNILQNKLQEVKQQNSDLQENITKLVETEGIFLKNNEKFQETLKSEEERHRRYEAQLQDRLNEQNIRYEDQKNEFNKVLDNFRVLQGDFKQIQKSEELLKDNIKSLTIEYNELQQQYTQQQEIIEETNKETIQFHKEHEKLKIEYASMEVALNDLQNEKNNLVLLVEKIKSDKEANTSLSLNKTVKLLESQIESIKYERDNLLKSIDSLNTDIINYRNIVANLEKERDSLKEKFNHFNNEKPSLLDEKYFELEKNNNILETRVKFLEIEKENLLEAKSNLENNLNETIKNMKNNEMNLIYEYKTKKIELEEIIRTKEHEQDNLTKQIQQLETTFLNEEQIYKVKIKQLNDEISFLQDQLENFKLQQKKPLEFEDSDEQAISNLRKDMSRLKNELYDTELETIDEHDNYQINYKTELSELKLKYKNANEVISNMKLEALAREEEFQHKINEIMLKEKSKSTKLQTEKAQIESTLFYVTQEKDALMKEKEQLQKQLSQKDNPVYACEDYVNENENINAIQQKELKERLMLAKAELNEVKENMKTREMQLKEQLHKIGKDKYLLINRIELAEKEIQSVTQEKKELSMKVYCLEKQLQENEHLLYNNQDQFKRIVNINNVSSKELSALKSKHKAELKGLSKQIYYLKARILREEQFRASLSYTKKFFLMKIDSYESCNQANLRLIEKMGIYPDRSIQQNRITLKVVILVVIIIERMKKLSVEWSKQTKIKEKLFKSLLLIRAN
ncbi:uncharacterized protein T551_00937 [Pneumocystis jirovecii RU7]|uniref:Centrosomin N-terminal motif 1 domain-containing protein n=1 Tax=Pneumocystis jirovecii (strain RU7) TaxID=1408657 RepID=A0A0W4ZTI1_PNEJ7|nr:uncharacterized protein T551_00937 [Pneumocystis jirovecii RU7]KTW31676.1 hypothetical protein T551_00937 [Pneumocystis jirovecii RU7]